MSTYRTMFRLTACTIFEFFYCLSTISRLINNEQHKVKILLQKTKKEEKRPPMGLIYQMLYQLRHRESTRPCSSSDRISNSVILYRNFTIISRCFNSLRIIHNCKRAFINPALYRPNCYQPGLIQARVLV